MRGREPSPKRKFPVESDRGTTETEMTKIKLCIVCFTTIKFFSANPIISVKFSVFLG